MKIIFGVRSSHAYTEHIAVHWSPPACHGVTVHSTGNSKVQQDERKYIERKTIRAVRSSSH